MNMFASYINHIEISLNAFFDIVRVILKICMIFRKIENIFLVGQNKIFSLT